MNRNGPQEESGDAPRQQPTIAKVSRPFLTCSQLELLKVQSGMSGVAGTVRRVEAFFLVWAACRQLRLPVRVFSTAMLFVQKVLLSNSLRDIGLPVVAGSCIICAFKIEDTPKKTADVATALLRVRGELPNTGSTSSITDDLTQRILTFEKQVLETVCFDFRVEHTHSYVIKLCHTLQTPQHIAALAWSIATDVYCTEAVLRHPAHTVALACVVVAAKSLGRHLGARADKLGSQRPEVNDVIIELLDWYLAPKVPLPGPLIASRALELSKLGSFREIVAREIHDTGSATDKAIGYEGLGLRDRNLSDQGTARFVLDWEREHLHGETLA